MERIFGRCFSILLFLMFFFGNCFGSVGNVNKERSETLINLIRLIRNEKVSFTPRVLFYDNQSDERIQDFIVRSNGIDYTVRIVSGSFAIKELRFRINPPTTPFAAPFPSIQSQSFDSSMEPENSSITTKTHTPFTVPLALPQDNPWGRIYTIPVNQTKTDFFTANDSDITGDIHTWALPSRNDFPQGLIASMDLEWVQMDLLVEITNNTPTTRTYRIRLEGKTESFLPRCRIELNRAISNQFSFGFRYSSLFRNLTTGSITNLTHEIFQITSNQIISNLNNSNLHDSLQRNLSSIDNVWTQHSCLF